MELTDEMINARMSGEGSLTPPRFQLHRLADVLRRAADTLLLVDAEHADESALADATEHADALLAALGALPNLRHHGSPARTPEPASLLSERSPVSGRTNPLASPLRIVYGRTSTTAEAVYTEAHEGPPGGVHGGLVAASFDELLGVAQVASGAAGFTGQLEITFRRITPLHTPIRYEAWVDGRHGRKVTVRATSHAGDDLLAEATGLFISQYDIPTEV